MPKPFAACLEEVKTFLGSKGITMSWNSQSGGKLHMVDMAVQPGTGWRRLWQVGSVCQRLTVRCTVSLCDKFRVSAVTTVQTWIL